MSTNSITYAAATGIQSDAQRDAIERDTARYADALSTASRAILDGFDTVAAYAYETARRVAHVAADHGNLDLILDQLERAYA
jgi:hypothetical protein